MASERTNIKHRKVQFSRHTMYIYKNYQITKEVLTACWLIKKRERFLLQVVDDKQKSMYIYAQTYSKKRF